MSVMQYASLVTDFVTIRRDLVKDVLVLIAIVTMILTHALIVLIARHLFNVPVILDLEYLFHVVKFVRVKNVPSVVLVVVMAHKNNHVVVLNVVVQTIAQSLKTVIYNPVHTMVVVVKRGEDQLTVLNVAGYFATIQKMNVFMRIVWVIAMEKDAMA